MAFIRLEAQKEIVKGKRQFDGICEAASDITSEASNGYAAFNGSHMVLGAGSLVLCLEDKKLYVKKDDMSWEEMTK